MTIEKDIVLTELVHKKKLLLDNLLMLSIQSLLKIPWQDHVISKRTELLTLLEKNDAAIATRQKQTGIEVSIQESGTLAQIETLMTSIQENNRATLMKLELAEKETERERSNLDRGKKLTNYLYRPQSNKKSHRQHQQGKQTAKLIKGTL